jgi:hypothetical protein
MLLFAAIAMFSCGAGFAVNSNNDDDDWDASEMNKEGMNYKE